VVISQRRKMNVPVTTMLVRMFTIAAEAYMSFCGSRTHLYYQNAFIDCGAKVIWGGGHNCGVFIRRQAYYPNSTYAICRRFAVDSSLRRIYGKTTANRTVYDESTANRESTAATQNLDMSRFWVADFTIDLRQIYGEAHQCSLVWISRRLVVDAIYRRFAVDSSLRRIYGWSTVVRFAVGKSTANLRQIA
jgi:hypothetical protein